MSLSTEQGMLVIVSAWDKLLLSHTNSVFKSFSWQLFQALFFSSSIIILLTNNIMISFDHPLCNLKNIAFLITPLHNVFKSFPFCFLYLAWQTIFFASRYFSLLVFPSFHSFHSFCFSLADSVSLGTDQQVPPGRQKAYYSNIFLTSCLTIILAMVPEQSKNTS